MKRVLVSRTIVDREALTAIKADQCYIGVSLSIGNTDVAVSPNFQRSTKVNRSLIEDALLRVNSRGFNLFSIRNRLTITLDLGKELGHLRTVATGPDDKCFFAPFRDSLGKLVLDSGGEPLYRRYVVGRELEPTSKLTLVVDKGPRLITAYVGPQCAPLPGCGASLEDCLWWFDPAYNTGHAFLDTEDERICQDLVWESVSQSEIMPWRYPGF